MSKVWFITGTSTGFGRDLAELALEMGNKVVATARKPETLSELTAKYGDSVLAVALDVTKPDTITNAVQAATDKFGRIDVLVNNAGYGVFGGFEEITEQQFREQYETNVFGVIAVTQAILPLLRAQRSGHILNVSSVAGLSAMPGFSAYASSKFALEGISEALAAEVRPLGIHVILVEPGAFRTAFGTTGISTGANPLPDYAPTTNGTIAWLEGMIGKQPGDPKKAAQAMLAIVEDPAPSLRLVLGGDALGMARQKIDSLTANLNQYESITNSTDYAEAAPQTAG